MRPYGHSTSGTSRPWRLAAAVGGVVVAADQGVKAAVEAKMTAGEHVDVLGPLALTLVHNRGVAFGLASGGGAALIALTVVALLFVAALFARDPDRPGMWLAIGLLVGGALGNLADRIRADAVTDYVDVLSWPPFNLADVAITAGVVVLGLSYARQSP
jgi:signal peptidase II